MKMKSKNYASLVFALALVAMVAASPRARAEACYYCAWPDADQPQCAILWTVPGWNPRGTGYTECEAYTRAPGTEGPVGCRLSGSDCEAVVYEPISYRGDRLNAETDYIVAALTVWMGTDQVVDFIQAVDEKVAALPADERALARYDAYLAKVTELTGIKHKRGDRPMAAPQKPVRRAALALIGV